LAERIKKSCCNVVVIMFRNYFIEQVVVDNNIFYYDNEDGQRFEKIDKSDFKFFEIIDSGIDLDNIFELANFF